VHPRTVQRLVERGELSAVHLGAAVRFDRQDLAGLIARVKRAPTGPASEETWPGRALSARAWTSSPSFRDRVRWTD
jgi:excisionase family DNA binding protein